MKKIIAAVLLLVTLMSGSCFAMNKDEVVLPFDAKFGMTPAEITFTAGEVGLEAKYYVGPDSGVNWSLIVDKASLCGRENPAYISVYDMEYAGYEAYADFYFDADNLFNSTLINIKTGDDDRDDLVVYTEQFEAIEATLTENFGAAPESTIEAYPRTFVKQIGDLKQIPYVFTTRLVVLDDGTVLYIEHYVFERKKGEVCYFEHQLGFTVIQ